MGIDNSDSINGIEKNRAIISDPVKREKIASRYIVEDSSSEKRIKAFTELVVDEDIGSEKTSEDVADFFNKLIAGSYREKKDVPRMFVIEVLGQLIDSGDMSKKQKVLDVLRNMVNDNDKKDTIIGDFEEMIETFVGPSGNDCYDGRMVAEDMIIVISLENYFSSIRKKTESNFGKSGEFLEEDLCQTPYLFGDSCFVNRSFLFDDLCNATDLFVEYKRGSQKEPRSLLSVDCTTNPIYEDVCGKVNRNKNIIKNGQFRHVTYFVSDNPEDPYTGGISCVPVVVGLTEPTLRIIDRIPDDEKLMKIKKIIFLEQIYFQLNYYLNIKDYFSEHPQKAKILLNLFKITQNQLSGIGEKTVEEEKILDLIREDPVYSTLKGETHLFTELK